MPLLRVQALDAISEVDQEAGESAESDGLDDDSDKGNLVACVGDAFDGRHATSSSLASLQSVSHYSCAV